MLGGQEDFIVRGVEVFLRGPRSWCFVETRYVEVLDLRSLANQSSQVDYLAVFMSIDHFSRYTLVCI